VDQAVTVRIEFVNADGKTTVLRDGLTLKEGEIIDATFMSRSALTAFLAEQVAAAKADGVLFSLHLKATMMKVSDPIIFGHAVKVFFRDFIAKHSETISELGVDFNNGLGDLLTKIASLPQDKRNAIE